MKASMPPKGATRLIVLILTAAGLFTALACTPTPDLVFVRCDLGWVDVSSSTATLHRYNYALDCGKDMRGEVHGAYDVTSGEAQEQLSGAQGRARAVWSCPRDPWIRAAADNFKCTRKSASATGTGGPVDVATGYVPDYPYGAVALTSAQRHLLATRLQSALKAKPPTTPPTQTPIPPLSAKLPTTDQAGSVITAQITAAPTNFQAKKDQSGLFIELTWTDNAVREGYYELRAFNHQSGNAAFRLTLPADTTRYIDTQSTSQVGGVDYELRTCHGADCSAPAKATFGA